MKIISLLLFAFSSIILLSCKKEARPSIIESSSLSNNAKASTSGKLLMVNGIQGFPEGSCVQWSVPKPKDPWGYCMNYSTLDKAKVTIADKITGKPVLGAMVTGEWSGAYNISGVSGKTNSNGFAEIDGLSGYTSSVTFTVINVTLNGSTYDSSNNLQTSVTIR